MSEKRRRRRHRRRKLYGARGVRFNVINNSVSCFISSFTTLYVDDVTQDARKYRQSQKKKIQHAIEASTKNRQKSGMWKLFIDAKCEKFLRHRKRRNLLQIFCVEYKTKNIHYLICFGNEQVEINLGSKLFFHSRNFNCSNKNKYLS